MIVDGKTPFVVDFDTKDGFCKSGMLKTCQRKASDMVHMFADTEAAKKAAESENPLIYEYYGLEYSEKNGGIGLPEKEGGLYFSTTIIYPGKIGNEYFMTKGHFHSILDRAEVYYCLSGKGKLIMETPEGETEVRDVEQGKAVYVPGRWSHRSVNTGTEPLVMIFIYPGDAGHDYGTIEEKGYRKLIVEKDGEATLVDNPKWR